jgi:hypothetical protein
MQMENLPKCPLTGGQRALRLRSILRLLLSRLAPTCPTNSYQPVVKVRRRTEADDAPGSQGAKRENTGSI